MKNTAQQLISSFSSLRVLIVGDVMVDTYYWGAVDRISPEAPVPILAVNKKEHRLGGAANVALNIASLGATPLLCSVIGNDDGGKLFINLLKKNNLSTEGINTASDRCTTSKTRILCNNHQMLRYDEEVTNDISRSETEKIIQSVETFLARKDVDVVIMQDYNKGVLTSTVIEKIIALTKSYGVPVAADPKKKNFFAYQGVTLFKPNLKEVKEGTGIDVDATNIETLDAAAAAIRKKVGNALTMITLSDKGSYITDYTTSQIVPAHIRNIADVSGAGDTVISVAALCMAAGAEIEAIAELSNLAGGIVCETAGVTPVDAQRLKEEALQINLSPRITP